MSEITKEEYLCELRTMVHFTNRVQIDMKGECPHSEEEVNDLWWELMKKELSI